MVCRGEVDKDLTEVRLRYRTQKADDKPANWTQAGGDGCEVETLIVNPDRTLVQKRFENITARSSST